MHTFSYYHFIIELRFKQAYLYVFSATNWKVQRKNRDKNILQLSRRYILTKSLYNDVQFKFLHIYTTLKQIARALAFSVRLRLLQIYTTLKPARTRTRTPTVRDSYRFTLLSNRGAVTERQAFVRDSYRFTLLSNIVTVTLQRAPV